MRKYAHNPDARPMRRETVCAEANPHVEIANQGIRPKHDCTFARF
jgi:hypothetical protein